MITVFTPTYNRGYILPVLYESLCRQTDFRFEWLVIDDGSIDDTRALFEKWLKEDHPFLIRYYRVENGGKPRAINLALTLAKGEYFFIVDSDDNLQIFAIEKLYKWFSSITGKSGFIGVSGIRGDATGNSLYPPPFIDEEKGYVDASYLYRDSYNLGFDMAEAYLTELLRNYHFPVWEDEKFIPEDVVWNAIASDGYKLRWFDEVIYNCDYQPNGLTNASWSLLKHNPMGYALFFNSNLNYAKSLEEKIYQVLQFSSCCFLARQYSYLFKSKERLLTCLLFPFGFLLSIRRRIQFRKFGV